MSKLKKALEKAKNARGRNSSISVPEDESSKQSIKSQEEKRGTEPDDSIHINYTKTKVLDIDPLVFKKNKVISLFHEEKMTDQLKILRTQVLNRLEEIEGNSLLVTSANPCEGKTFTAINLGISIAQELDRTVLLIDADLRRHSIRHHNFADDFFGVDINRGLSDYLSDQAQIPDLLINPGIQKLTILPGGKPLPNSAELLGSAKMESLVTEMKDRYSNNRIIIFDSPSLLTCPDPMVLSRFADGILLVVEAEKTSSNDLKRALELLSNKLVLGTLLNKAKT